MQLFQFGIWIGNLQQRAVVIMTSALPQIMHATFQIHHHAIAAQCGAILFIQHCATASRQNYVVALHQVLDDACFALAKAGFTLDIKNVRDCYAGTLLNLHVTINKSLAHLLGKCFAYCGFSCAHHSYQKDVAGWAFGLGCGGV